MLTDHTAALDTTPLPLRGDTILGVCEALGQDFGFHPNLLRITLATLVLWSPMMAFGLYFALGAVVLLSRLIAPPRREIAAAPVQLHLASETQAENEDREASALAA